MGVNMIRYIVTQGSEQWSRITWWNVFDQSKQRPIARCENQADAANVCSAMNAYNDAALKAQR
jgi:hypothetical protein